MAKVRWIAPRWSILALTWKCRPPQSGKGGYQSGTAGKKRDRPRSIADDELDRAIDISDEDPDQSAKISRAVKEVRRS